jgi:hypothetical protein
MTDPRVSTLRGTRCPECDERIDYIGDGVESVDPVTFQQIFTCHPCGHRSDREHALYAHHIGIRVHVPKVSAAAIVAAEQARARAKGHSPEDDAALPDGVLSWALWCLTDAARKDASPSPDPPTAWPAELGPERWPSAEPSIRKLVIALAYGLSELDKRLAAGETP